MSETFMDRLISDLKTEFSRPRVSSFNGQTGDIVVSIPEIVSGVYECTGNQNGQVVYIDHEQGRTPDMVFAYIAKGGTTEMNTAGTASLFVFATIPIVNGLPSTTQLSILIPDIDTSTKTKIHWTALFQGSQVAPAAYYMSRELDTTFDIVEGEVENLEQGAASAEASYSEHLNDGEAHATVLEGDASEGDVTELSNELDELENQVTEQE